MQFHDIMEMVKLFDQQPRPDGADGSAAGSNKKPSLEELLAYLHQANAATNPAALLERQAAEQRFRDASVASGFASNFEDIIAQHIQYNGNAKQQQMLQQHQAQAQQAREAAAAAAATANGNSTSSSAASGSKRKQAKRSTPQLSSKTQAALTAALNNARLTSGAQWQGDELVQQIYTDEHTVALFRSLGPIEGVSVEFHRLDEEEEAAAAAALKKTKGGKANVAAPPAKASAQHKTPPPPIVEELLDDYADDIDDVDDERDDVDDDEDDGDIDLEDSEDVVVHEEDLQQINHMIQCLEPLSQATLEELSNEWEVSFPNGGEHLLYRTNITERIRYLAATMVVGVADRFQVLQNNNTNTTDAERERMMLVNNLVLSLWHGINVLTESVRKNFAVIFGLEADSTAHDVCVAVAGLGIAAFFEPLPVPLIETVCRELSLPPPDSKTDPDLLHEVLAHQICAHFYPVLGKLPDMNLRCTTQLTVHENGPGSYTCTIDNALLMDLVMRQVHTSNKFTCSKTKWRARVEIVDGHLNFSVWHRENKTFNCHLILRTSDPRKKKKLLQDDTNGTLATGGLYLEKQDTAYPEARVGFTNIVPLQQVYRNLTTSPNGLRLYNRSEDRVVFQFAMEITQVENETAPAAAAHPRFVTAALETHQMRAAQLKAKNIASAAAAAAVDMNSATGQTIAELIEQEEREKKEKAAQKAKMKNDKRFKQHELQETTARDQILSQWQTAMNQISQDYNKSLQKALQKKKDRERKQELAKATPSAELQTQLVALEQTVRAARSALAKLIQEKTREEKEGQTLRAQIESRNQELEKLQSASESHSNELERLQVDIKEAEERSERKKKALERKAERASKRRPPPAASSTHNVDFNVSSNISSLAIGDIHSFWHDAPQGGMMMMPQQQQHAQPPPLSSIGGGALLPSAASSISVSAMGPNNGGGLFDMFGGTPVGHSPLTGGSSMPQSMGMSPSMMSSNGGGAMSRSAMLQQQQMHNNAFGLNSDAQPFYGSTFVEQFGQKPTMGPGALGMGGPQMSAPPRGYVGTAPPQVGQGPLMHGGGFAPPNGFNPYGVNPMGQMGRMPTAGHPQQTAAPMMTTIPPGQPRTLQFAPPSRPMFQPNGGRGGGQPGAFGGFDATGF